MSFASLSATIWSDGARSSPNSPMRSVTDPCRRTVVGAVNTCVRCPAWPDWARYEADVKRPRGKRYVRLPRASQSHTLFKGNRSSFGLCGLLLLTAPVVIHRWFLVVQNEVLPVHF